MSRKRKKQVKAPDFLKGLSKPPEDELPQRALYHGTRIALLALLAVAVTLLFPSESLRAPDLPQEGEVATEDVAAQVGFEIPKDPVELARQQREAQAAVPPVFQYDPTTEEDVEADLDEFFDRIQAAVGAGGLPEVERVLREEAIALENAEVLLDSAKLSGLRQATLAAVRRFGRGVFDSEYEQEVLSAGQVQIRLGDGTERLQNANEIMWRSDFYAAAVAALGPGVSEQSSIVRLLLIRFFRSPYSLDLSRTAARRAEARAAVPTAEGRVVAGAFIVRRGDQIGSAEFRKLDAHQDVLRTQGLIRDPGRDWGALFGHFLLNLTLLSIFGFLLFFYRREVYGNFRWVLLLAFLVLAYFLAAAGISWQAYPWELLPIAFVVLPVAILWDGRMALIMALVLGVLTGAQAPFRDFSVLGFIVVGGAAAALSARAVRRRSQTWIFIALITAGSSLALLAFGLSAHLPPGSVLLSIVYAGMNATVSSILAMGFMPLFEWATGITTDQTLLEWADPNRPLLKSLSLEAGGTYAHTISVANLAEAAATAIGANGLLARVGIYYHDVGKMLKPQYFVENQPGGRNPHDKLKPHTSATIVKEHVIEGERMARDAGVPDVVARFIPEHHGTQLIGFFYEKAREESGEEPNPEEFRYPGPKPRSKETAIAMFADSVESAARALQDPSPERVRELVKNIIDGKIRDGQLSDSPLTLREIDLVQEQFVKVVSGMFHQRLDYPATQHLTKAQVGSPPASPPVGAGADEVATATPPGPDGEGAAAVPEAREAGRKKAGGGSGNEQLPLAPTDEESPSRDPHADE